MPFKHEAGNLYWDDHTARYHLCVVGQGDSRRIISYPYFYLETIGEEQTLSFGEHCAILDSHDLSPLERQCCIEFLGKVGGDLVLSSQEGSLLSRKKVTVQVPKLFHRIR